MAHGERQRYDWDEWSDEPDHWNSNTGAPGIWQLQHAVQLWSIFQNRPTSVREAAEAFNVDPHRIIEAIDEGNKFTPVYLDGPRDDIGLLLIEHDGE